MLLHIHIYPHKYLLDETSLHAFQHSVLIFEMFQFYSKEHDEHLRCHKTNYNIVISL